MDILYIKGNVADFPNSGFIISTVLFVRDGSIFFSLEVYFIVFYAILADDNQVRFFFFLELGLVSFDCEPPENNMEKERWKYLK